MPFQGGDYNRLVRNITAGDFIQPREQSGNRNYSKNRIGDKDRFQRLFSPPYYKFF
jgi:hypothetical protein